MMNVEIEVRVNGNAMLNVALAADSTSFVTLCATRENSGGAEISWQTPGTVHGLRILDAEAIQREAHHAQS